MKTSTKLLCPSCRGELQSGNPQKFETLSEHVFDPNYEGETPLRPTLICANSKCPTHGKCFWNLDGEWYPDMSVRIDKKDFNFIDNDSAPLNSTWRQINKEIGNG